MSFRYSLFNQKLVIKWNDGTCACSNDLSQFSSIDVQHVSVDAKNNEYFVGGMPYLRSLTLERAVLDLNSFAGSFQNVSLNKCRLINNISSNAMIDSLSVYSESPILPDQFASKRIKSCYLNVSLKVQKAIFLDFNFSVQRVYVQNALVDLRSVQPFNEIVFENCSFKYQTNKLRNVQIIGAAFNPLQFDDVGRIQLNIFGHGERFDLSGFQNYKGSIVLNNMIIDEITGDWDEMELNNCQLLNIQSHAKINQLTMNGATNVHIDQIKELSPKMLSVDLFGQPTLDLRGIGELNIQLNQLTLNNMKVDLSLLEGAWTEANIVRCTCMNSVQGFSTEIMKIVQSENVTLQMLSSCKNLLLDICGNGQPFELVNVPDCTVDLQLRNFHLDLNKAFGVFKSVTLTNIKITGLASSVLQINELTIQSNFRLDQISSQNAQVINIELKENQMISFEGSERLHCLNALSIYGQTLDFHQITGAWKQVSIQESNMLGNASSLHCDRMHISQSQIQLSQIQHLNCQLDFRYTGNDERFELIQMACPTAVHLFNVCVGLNAIVGYDELFLEQCKITGNASSKFCCNQLVVVNSDFQSSQVSESKINSLTLQGGEETMIVNKLSCSLVMLDVDGALLDLHENYENISSLEIYNCSFRRFSMRYFPFISALNTNNVNLKLISEKHLGRIEYVKLDLQFLAKHKIAQLVKNVERRKVTENLKEHNTKMTLSCDLLSIAAE
ncbi:Hypothetical_protein [Hexamita inflata]|uniref:Hypothetical_protein n=1 Tax=Hexamita inflata TaxID=28002 RepID=A0AA86UR55_9EUKA|nr:Hypothetical protein HINF_LOCUS48976 [Hexamita inflata]